MADITIKMESIFGGESPTEYFSSPGQFRASYAIDPDFPLTDSGVKMSGMIRPTSMAKFSASEITGVPLWIVVNPKDTNAYVYCSDGKVHVVNSSLAMGTALNSGSALSSANGNGAAYYDNYLYLAKQTDVARYGPLNGSPSLVQDYWTSTLGKAALINTTYPSLRGITLPNHVMHRHTDNKLYFADVVGNQGVLHYIRTSKSSAEGDTNDASTFNALDFPYGEWPTAIETYGTDLCVALVEGLNATVKQSRAKLSFWNTTDDSFSKIFEHEFPDPIITAVKNVNGNLYVFSGNTSGGCRVSVFAGGYSVQEIAYYEDSLPPFPDAVEAELSRIYFGGSMTDPDAVAVVKSIGSKRSAIPMGIHTPFKASSSGTNGWVSAIRLFEQASAAKTRPIIGWSDDSGKGLDKISTTYGAWLFQSPMYRIGRPFQIKKITIPLGQAMASNMTITPKILYDDASKNETGGSGVLPVINSTNFASSERQVVLYPQEIGYNNYYLELKGSGTALIVPGLPITFEIDYVNN